MTRDNPKEAGTLEEIEVTPAMIEAGEEALASVNFDFETHEDAAMRIYRTMENARLKAHISHIVSGRTRVAIAPSRLDR